jgi:RHS repeat-associated protein
MTLTRNPQNGQLKDTTLSNVIDAIAYNGFGETSSYSSKYNSTTLYGAVYTRDQGGRIVTKSETINSTTKVYEYSYFSEGWLKDVKVDGTIVAAYSYDQNGNRLSKTAGTSTTTGTYDAQDRLVSYGASTYAYNLNGELRTKIAGNETSDYTDDGLGNLTTARIVDAASNSSVSVIYVIDASNRRIGKWRNGLLVQGFLYQNGLKPIAETDGGSGNVISRFVYASKAHVPDYMIKGGTIYRIVSDHLGSVRLVVDASTGAVMQQLEYDEFGKVLSDSNPGFQPFGYAGGLYDADTKLVKFGARDYDAETGRWLSKEPLGFAGSSNFYSYAGNEPINHIDITGLKTSIVFWNPSGASGSMFGHVEFDIDGKTYTFEPFASLSAPQDYDSVYQEYRRQRGARSYPLNISPEQEQQLIECLKAQDPNYHGITNNCTDPVLTCLNKIGKAPTTLWLQTPSNLEYDLYQDGIINKYEKIGNANNAPWEWPYSLNWKGALRRIWSLFE